MAPVMDGKQEAPVTNVLVYLTPLSMPLRYREGEKKDQNSSGKPPRQCVGEVRNIA
jgi:hypothetical protein